MVISKFFRRFKILAFAFQKFLGVLVFSVRNSCVLRSFSVRFPFIRLFQNCQTNLKSFVIMNHVIITLPIQLWEEIYAGRKLFELRKSIPLIHPFSGRVYVVIKGTSIVPGYFTLSGIIGSDDAYYLWEFCSGNLSITKEEYQLYASTMRKCLYAWEIDSVYEYNRPLNIKADFGIERNPQSHFYTTAEPKEKTEIVRGLKHPQYILDLNEVMPISLYYHGSWYDRIPEKTYNESELEKAIQ